MPELPEVEATRRHLAPVLVGSTIIAVEVRRERMIRRQERPGDFEARLSGRRVLALNRRGKFLLAGLEGDFTWVTHLGMSGRISITEPDSPEADHTNVIVRPKGRPEVRMIDPRTFGFVAVFTPDELGASSLSRLGPDALMALPDAKEMGEGMARRSIPVKVLLLDQTFIAGIGNIYADEILFRAGVAPHRPASSLPFEQVVALHDAIVPVLEDGLRHGGTSLEDLAYLLPDDRAGEYLERLSVYGRDGEPCLRCGSEVRRSVLGQRSAHWCPSCQR